jgi:hypothetical protein
MHRHQFLRSSCKKSATIIPTAVDVIIRNHAVCGGVGGVGGVGGKEKALNIRRRAIKNRRGHIIL